ncbi:MAG: HAMP domain-containing sensor histidine kinase [Candidatus Dormibacteria bacterium]|jgi:signal transduction histidine kinase
MQRTALGDGRTTDPDDATDGVAEVIGERLSGQHGEHGAARDPLAAGREAGDPGLTEVEELRRRLERMVALDKMKSDYLHLTVHELRSPLAIVYGYLSMIESGMLGELTPQLRGAVEPSMRSVELMTQLVTELIETARLDDAQMETAAERVDVAEVLAEAALRVSRSELHELRLDLGTAPAIVVGDRARLLRVFGNLVDNAVKYSPGGGEILIRLTRRGLDVVVDVSDQGLGIPEGAMDRLFTRFGRVVTPRNEDIEGTGLGLYLCREMVRRLGGDVTATSAEGQGSTFTVRLPAEAPSPDRRARA